MASGSRLDFDARCCGACYGVGDVLRSGGDSDCNRGILEAKIVGGSERIPVRRRVQSSWDAFGYQTVLKCLVPTKHFETLLSDGVNEDT